MCDPTFPLDLSMAISHILFLPPTDNNSCIAGTHETLFNSTNIPCTLYRLYTSSLKNTVTEQGLSVHNS